MDFAEKQRRRAKAKQFVGSSASVPAPAKRAASKQKTDKKHVAYYLDRELIKNIRIEAAQRGIRPCHLVERAVKRFLANASTAPTATGHSHADGSSHTPAKLR